MHSRCMQVYYTEETTTITLNFQNDFTLHVKPQTGISTQHEMLYFSGIFGKKVPAKRWYDPSVLSRDGGNIKKNCAQNITQSNKQAMY